MKHLACIALLVASTAFGQPALKLPAEVRGAPGEFVRVPAETTGKAVSWYVVDAGLNLFPIELQKSTLTAVVTTVRPGRYRLLAYTAKGDAPSLPAVCVVIIGDAPPGPGPEPGPQPPDPQPGPVPIPGDGLRVLIVYETAEASKLPIGQQSVLYSKTVRDYLNAKCPVGPDGKTKDWRIYDADVDLSGEAKTWQDAMKRPRSAVPWIVISNGKTGHEGPLPKSVDEAMTLLKKFGGE